MQLTEINSFEKITVRQIQFGSLLVLGLLECVTILLGSTFFIPMTEFVTLCMNLAGAMFLGASIRGCKCRSGKKLLTLGLAFCAWVAVLQVYDFRYFSTEHFYSPRFGCSTFLVEYAMLLPFAGILDEREKATGLNILGGCYAAAAVVLVLMTIVLCAGRVPAAFASIFEWYGYRLGLMWHPNILAALFLIGISVNLYFLQGTRKPWLKIVLGVLTGAEFVCSAITHSRAVNLMVCCVMGGLVFFLVYRKRTVRRFLLGLLAAVLVIGLLFSVCSGIYQKHCEIFNEQGTMSVEELEDESAQQSLAENFSSFNGRTNIWKAAFLAIRDHPQVLVIGTRVPGDFISPYNFFKVYHAHNSWLQALLGLGTVGFLFTVVITILIFKSCLMLFFFKESTLSQKTICLLTIAVMGAEFFEPHLFYTPYLTNIIQMMFMICAGYVIYWDDNAAKIR